MTTVISDDSLRNTKASNDMVKKKKCCSPPGIIKCRHRLGPFREIINSYDNISMPPGRVRVTGHEVNAPFSERTYGGLQDEVEQGATESFDYRPGTHDTFEQQ
jgi:hypothetical protein